MLMLWEPFRAGFVLSSCALNGALLGKTRHWVSALDSIQEGSSLCAAYLVCKGVADVVLLAARSELQGIHA